jgi:hypothetical protein
MVASGSVVDTFLILPALARVLLRRDRLRGPVLVLDLRDVAPHQALPAHIGSNQRGVEVDDLPLRDLGRQAGLHRALKDPPEPRGPPPLPDACQRRMVGQRLVKTVADEPANREIDLRFAEQAAVMDHPKQKSREHEAYSHLGVDPGAPVVGAVEISHLVDEPREIEHPSHRR